jgi:chromosome segregation ATPase
LDSWIGEIDNHARLLRVCRTWIANAERQTVTLTAEVADWRSRASRKADELEALEKRASDESRRRSQATAALETAAAQIRELEARITALRQAVETAEAGRAQAVADLQTERREHETSREELLRRLQVASEARLGEFKNRLGHEIGRIVSHVPALGGEQPPEMLKVLHVRIHDVISALRAAGVNISR